MPFGAFFDPDDYPWEWLPRIKVALAELQSARIPATIPPGVSIEGIVYIHPSVELPPFCRIKGPAWIGEGVEIRPGAYIRGNVIIGAGSVVGNSCEFKNAILMEKAQVPHYSYVGDSILGSGAHLGAGVICSNLRLDQKNVNAIIDGQNVDSGLRKFGAILGENAEVGCNTALMPGAILGKRALVGPVVSFSGTLDAEQLYLGKNPSSVMARRD